MGCRGSKRVLGCEVGSSLQKVGPFLATLSKLRSTECRTGCFKDLRGNRSAGLGGQALAIHTDSQFLLT